MFSGFLGSAQSCPVRVCSSSLASSQAFVYCSQTDILLPPGPFSEDIKILAQCLHLLLPAALPGTTTSGQVAQPALSFSVLLA